MSVQKIPGFTIPGVVVDRRELKTKADGRTWAYSVKLMAMGGTYEVTTPDEALWKKVGDGESGVVAGRFDQFKGAIKLVLMSWVPDAAK